MESIQYSILIFPPGNHRISPSRGGEAAKYSLQHCLQPRAGRGQRGGRHQHGQVSRHQTRPRQHRDVHTLCTTQLLQVKLTNFVIPIFSMINKNN